LQLTWEEDAISINFGKDHEAAGRVIENLKSKGVEKKQIDQSCIDM